MIALNGIDKQGIDINGVQVKQTLSAASETVNKGVYHATTLSAVDADLAVGNISDGVTIFGFLGTYTPITTLSEDVESYSDAADVPANALDAYDLSNAVAASDSYTIASLTQSYDVTSLTFAVGSTSARAATTGYLKGQLLMDGVVMQSSGYLTSTETVNYTLHDFKAITGSCDVVYRIKNDDSGGSRTFYRYGRGSQYYNTGTPGFVAAGSVKI
ncbi:hypothetical protein ACFLXC_04120 [Chloroflexota bacterium]